MRERPSMQALAVFSAVVDAGSMTAAAATGGISQPAISSQIKALEGYYGTAMLERGGRGSVPTAAGHLVADYAARVLALVDELGRVVADHEGLGSGRLIVGASSTVGEQLLPTHLGRFHAAHPGVELSMRIGNSDEITALVAGRALDFAFVGHRPADHDLLAEPFFEDAIVAFVAPGDPVLARAPIAAAALTGSQFVMREGGSATRALAEECLRSTGCVPSHIIELGSNEAVKRAVEARLGIGLLSTHAVEAERLAGLLVDLPLTAWDCRRSFWLIRRRDRTLTRAEQAFLALLR